MRGGGGSPRFNGRNIKVEQVEKLLEDLSNRNHRDTKNCRRPHHLLRRESSDIDSEDFFFSSLLTRTEQKVRSLTKEEERKYEVQ